MHMREAGKVNSDISSSELAPEYIRRLKVAWVTWLVYGCADEAKWVQGAKAITAEFGKVAVDEAEVEAVEFGPLRFDPGT